MERFESPRDKTSTAQIVRCFLHIDYYRRYGDSIALCQRRNEEKNAHIAKQ